MSNSEKRNTKQSQSPKKRKKKSAWKIVGITTFSALVLLVAGGGAGLAYVMSQVKNAPALDLQKLSALDSTSFIYDRNGQQIGETQGDGNRVLIKNLSEVSPAVVQAFVSGEDKNFYHHHGINPLAMLRAAFQNFTGDRIVSGASTITQQTIKNVFFPDQSRTIQRKLEEAYLSVKLEQALTKDEIMTTYLNWIYFGQSKSGINLYGIESASKAFFGIPANKLNVAQSAMLAALPNNPANLNPFYNLKDALVRQNYILDRMHEDGYIDDKQLAEAKAFDIKGSLVKQEVVGTNISKYPYLTSEAEQRAAEALLSTKQYDNLDDAKKALDRGGFKVYTTIDTKMQDSVDSVLQSDASFPSGTTVTVKKADGTTVQEYEQAGATLIDNKTGGILAVGGGRNFKDDQNNHTLTPRQPGSTMKPIGVYGPAVERKIIFPGMGIDDVPTMWPGYTKVPHNWDDKFHGLMSARMALEQSLNIPALKVFDKLTPAVGLGYVKKMGVTTLSDGDMMHLGSAIGGLDNGISDEELTSAFTTFPNQGIHKDSYLIDHIVDSRGNTIFKKEPKDTKVFTQQTAFILTDMLQDVVRGAWGTATTIGNHFPGKPIAGKTGTTDENKDAWFVGYTPDVTLGIWVGYDTPRYLAGAEGHRPQVLWNSMMDKIYPLIQNQQTQFSPPPAGVQKVTVFNLSGKLPTDLDKQFNQIDNRYGDLITSDWFTSDMIPTQSDDIVVKAKYMEVGGKKVIVSDPKIPVGGPVKEGLFFKRDPYTLPDNNPAYRPLDYLWELPTTGSTGSSTDKKTDIVPSPSDLQAAASLDNGAGVSLTWSAVPNVDGYVVFRSDASGTFQAISDILPKPGYVDKTAVAGGNYSYYVSSFAKGNIQPPGNTVTVTGSGGTASAGSPSGSPSGLTVTQGPVGPHLSWNPVNGAISYTIYRSTDGSNYEQIDSVKTTKYDDAGLLGGKATYEVTAVTATGESSPSAPASISGGGSGGGAASPTPSISNPHTGSDLDLSWKSVPGASSYEVDRSLDGSTWAVDAQIAATAFRDSGLNAGTKYYYRLKVISAGGASSPSQTVTGTP